MHGLADLIEQFRKPRIGFRLEAADQYQIDGLVEVGPALLRIAGLKILLARGQTCLNLLHQNVDRRARIQPK